MSFENIGPSVKSVPFCILTLLLTTATENGVADSVSRRIVRMWLIQEVNHSFTITKKGVCWLRVRRPNASRFSECKASLSGN